jgi:ferredoxin-NADP reductase
MSMIRFAAASGLEIPVSLVCSAATYDHAFYREELAQLATQHRWLRVVHTVTRDLDDPRALYHRRIDASMLGEVLNGTIPPQAFLCGPPAMVETAATVLHELGVNPERVHSEKYD